MKTKGYYDLLLSLQEQADESFLTSSLTKEADNISDIDNYIMTQFNEHILQHLKTLTNTSDKLTFINQLLMNFSGTQFSDKVLLQVAKDKSYQSSIRLVDNYLFTNDNEQELIQQLIDEITSCDQVAFIYPFISKPMINKLRSAFKYAFSNNIPISFITTTFDDQALFVNLYELGQLIKQFPNITIRIEDNSQKRSERIHIKAAIFIRNSGFSSAIIGSSNLTTKGMATGREWNIKINQFNDKVLYKKILDQYYKIWNDNLLDFNNEEVRAELLKRIEEQRRKSSKESHITFTSYLLYDFQIAILEKLKFRRKINKHKHLIVMATGTGKTVVSAFDYLTQIKEGGKKSKLLFLAHQKEIIDQALSTFRSVLKDGVFGQVLNSKEKNFSSKYLFATIQTLHRHLKNFDPHQFDIIIFDEAHHIAAKTFDQVFNYFSPQEIIGLTATPEREDSRNILPYFNNEFAYELRLWDAINQKLLSKFDYYCIDDISSDLVGVDLSNNQQVFSRLNTQSRNQLLLEVIKNYIGVFHQPIALVFCINTSHAQIIANFLQQQGLKADYLTNKVTHLREEIISDFKSKKINYLCVVNIFNEGVDIPEVDTLILLRPTSSKTVYLQQLGRGLRKVEGKNQLSIYDLIANIDKKYDITIGIKNLYYNQNLQHSNKVLLKENALSLPYGCTITLESKSKEVILKNLQEWYKVPNAMHQVVLSYYSKYQTQGLVQILKDYDLDLVLFYNYLNDFYFKIGRASLLEQEDHNKTLRNKNLLKQFLFLNDYQIINYFYLRLKNQPHTFTINYHYDNLLICSLFYEVTSMKVFNKYFSSCDEDLVVKFIKQHKLIVEELLIILKYKIDNETLIFSPFYKDNHPSLLVGSTFTVRQALCAINRVNFIKHLGPLKIIAFQAGYLTYDCDKTVVFADIDASKYGKKTNYLSSSSIFYWSIPENKDLKSKLVFDLRDISITKFLFLNNSVNKKYPNLNLKLYNFIGVGQYQETIIDKYITIKFKVDNKETK